MTEQRLWAILEEINNSEAIKIYYRLRTLGVNFFVFGRNFEELQNVLNLTEQPEKMLALWSLRNRPKLELMMQEVTRLMHNFLASAKTLVDHTRVLIRDWYQGTKFLEEYESQVAKRFTSNSLVGFVEGLRNYSLHYALPFTGATFSIGKIEKGQSSLSDLRFSFSLSKSELLRWAKWPAKAKAYLQKAEEEIEIRTFVVPYYHQIENFHLWMYKRLQETHADQLSWLSEMRSQALSLMSEEDKRERGLDT